MRPFRRTTLLAATAIFLQAVSPAAADDMAGDADTVRVEYLPLSGPPLLLYQNARRALAAGNPQKAIDDLNEAIRQRPDSGELRTALVDALLAAGRDDEAQNTALAAAKDARIDAATRRWLSARAVSRDPAEADGSAKPEPPTKPQVAERAGGETEEAPAGQAEDAELDDDAVRRLSELAARIRREQAEETAGANRATKPAIAEKMESEPGTAPSAGAEGAELDDEAIRRLSELAASIRREQAEDAAGAERANLAAPSPEASSAAAAPTTDDPAYKVADAAYRAYERGDYRKAVADARDAVRLAPDDGDYRKLLENAEKALAAADARPAGSSPAARAAREAYAALGRDDNEAALRHARQAVRLAPGDRAYQVLLIDVLNRNGMYEEALRVADAAIARFGKDRTLLGQRGVVRQERGDQAGAMADFELALAAPGPAGDEAQLRLNLAAAAMATDAPALAYQALVPLGDSRDAAVWLARAKALTAMESFTAASTALAEAEAKAVTDRQKADIAVAGLDLLMVRDGGGRARAALQGAQARGLLAPLGATETAYLAARLGDRPLAYDAFREAYAAGAIEGGQLIDAAYAARRDYHNEDAVFWLKRAIDEADAGRLALSPEELFNLRREVSDISRRWGANIGLYYGSSGISDAYVTPSAAAGRSMQLGSELFWRPPVIGYRDARTIDFFIRQFTTLYDSLGGAVGAPTTQGAAGVRIKPFTNLNLTVEAARYFRIGRYSRDDYLLRAAISDGFNTDLMPGSSAWWTGRYYGEAGRYIESNEQFALGNASLGRSFRLGDDENLIITPFIGISADYNNTYATAFALGAGPGLNLRYWFRETKYEAPMSYLDINGQYRARLGGDDRAQGWFASVNLMI